MIGLELTRLAGQLAELTSRWLELLAEFDRRSGWHEAGLRSCAEWVAWHCAVSPSRAREQVRVARALERLPRTAALFRRGELSYSKVRALARLERVEDEETVLAFASDATASQLERIVGSFRSAASLEAGARRARSERFLRLEPDEDGTVRLRGRLGAEEAAVLQAALDEFGRRIWKEAGTGRPSAQPGQPGSREDAESIADQEATAAEQPTWTSGAPLADEPPGTQPGERRQAGTVDALVRLADAALAADAGADRRTPERHQVVVHADLATLIPLASAPLAADAAGGTDASAAAGAPTEPPGTGMISEPRPATLADGTPLALSVLRRLSCDGSISLSLEEAGKTLDVGRRTRTVPSALRRALEGRDGGCRFPGCQARRHLDAHHIEHWAAGGETCADNLVCLCRRHHTALHEGGFGVARRSDGTLVFTTQTGEDLPICPPVPGAPGRRRSPRRRRRGSAAGGPRPGSNLPYDLHAAVEALFRIAPPSAPSDEGGGGG